jgi:hypothetical protein
MNSKGHATHIYSLFQQVNNVCPKRALLDVTLFIHNRYIYSVFEIVIAGPMPMGVQFYGLAGGCTSISDNMALCSCMLL